MTQGLILVCLFPYNYTSENFREVFWGVPPKIMGRGHTALKWLLEIDGCLLIGGGNAWVPVAGTSGRERESILEHEILCWSLLKDYIPFQLKEFSCFTERNINHLDFLFNRRAGSRIFVDESMGKNTETVAQWMRSVFDELDNGQEDNTVFVVADYGHLRAFGETAKAFKDIVSRVKIIFVPGDTPYAGEPGDIGIAEAPILQQSGAREDFTAFINRYKVGATTAVVDRVQK